MDKELKRIQSSISKEEAERAIYIDFEGFEDMSPTMLGILIEESFEQVVFDEALKPAALKKNMRMNSIEAEIVNLIRTCNNENRLIVAYSQHEFNIIREYANQDISQYYRDARMIAKKWRNRLYRDSCRCKSLKDYLSFIGFNRPSHLGERKTTSRIKSVKDMLLRRGDYDSLTPTTKAKWTKLLEHNEIDCKGMRALVRTTLTT